MKVKTLELQIGPIHTPIGEALVVFDDEKSLRAFDWKDHEDRMLRLLRRQYGVGLDLRLAKTPNEITRAFDAYFGGDLKALEQIPCQTAGTPFQREVWSALRSIPAGQTRSYGQLAAKLGRPKAMRAVGLANGSNPIGVVVPCHRVIGADGSLTGYGGGLDRKRWLLTHEGAAIDASV